MLTRILFLPGKSIISFGWILDLRGLLFSIFYRAFPNFRMKIIKQYIATEFDSGWQLLYAAERSEDIVIRVKLFTQALEEFHHADIFSHCLNKQSAQSPSRLHFEKAPLYSSKEDFWRLFAYCKIGEAYAVKRFSMLAKVVPKGTFLNALREVVEDEIGHVELASNLVLSKDISEAEYKSEIRKIKLKRFKESVLRIQQRLFNSFCSLILFLFYFLVGPIIFVCNKLKGRGPL